MTVAHMDGQDLQKPLRLWPGVLAVTLQWLTRFALPTLFPSASLIAVLGGVVGGLLVLVWWLFFSRAPHVERWGALVLMIAAIVITRQFLHESIATAGQGALFFIYAIPVLSLALVVWATASRNLSPWPRRLALIATVVLASGSWTLVKTGGITGDSDSDFSWRFSKTPEERLLATDTGELPEAQAGLEHEADWPGFRGHNRDGKVRGVWIETDWALSPPVELWRRPIGPGWSSFAVGGDLLYTQEQRGDDEIVSSYRIDTGEPVWRHADSARF